MHQEQERLFTLTVLTENEAGALVRLTTTLARHRMRVESLTSTSDGVRGVSRHIVLVRSVHDRVRRATKQIRASVGVLAADCYGEGDTVDREIALFKLDLAPGSPEPLRELVRAWRARVLVRADGYLILEKTGSGTEIQAFYEALASFGVLEFVRSGRVVVTRTDPARRVATGAATPA